MSDLVAWLTKILDEDQATAERGPGLASLPSLEYFETDEYIGIEANSRWLLADIEAKREILSRYRQYEEFLAPQFLYDQAQSTAIAYRDVVRLLAVSYADRPGYREEW